MKKSFFKKALTMFSAVVMAGAIGLGAGVGVNAADDDDANSTLTTKVILTKYATTGAKDSEQDPTQQKPLGADTVKGAEFTVYDVTNQYWGFVDDGTINASSDASSDASNDVSTQAAKLANSDKFTLDADTQYKDAITTGDDGTAEIDVANADSKGREAVYLFKETNTPKGFTASTNFVLGISDKVKAKGTAYVYPKDEISGSYQLKFTKVDANSPETTLKGASFYIKNIDGLYAALANEATATGFSADLKTVSWVKNAADATVFTSDGQGEFGFAAQTETTKSGTLYGLSSDRKYTIEEKTAPTGYEKNAKIVGKDVGKDVAKQEVKATDKDSDATVVTDSPEGILPHTGGKGIIAIIAAGLLITVLGVMAYTKRRGANA